LRPLPPRPSKRSPMSTKRSRGCERRRRNKDRPPSFLPRISKSKLFLSKLFPNNSLVVLCDFKGLQDFQTTFGGFQIFPSLSPPFSRILDPARPHSVAPRGMGSSALSRSRAFELQECTGRVHGRGVIRIERIFNLARSQIIRKGMSIFLPRTARRFSHEHR
jgi:hypothetical protein